MAYSTSAAVLVWAQMSSGDLEVTMTDFDTTITNFITYADDIIEEYCKVPSGFFDAAGVTVTDEYHDGRDVGHVTSWVRYTGHRKVPKLRLKYSPVISVTTLSEETSAGAWTARTEGRGDDYLVTETGVRFLQNIPSYDYKNVKVTYVAGYAATPSIIAIVSARLAANMLHRIIDSKSRTQSAGLGSMSAGFGAEFMGVAKPILTQELKKMLRPYKRVSPTKII